MSQFQVLTRHIEWLENMDATSFRLIDELKQDVHHIAITYKEYGLTNYMQVLEEQLVNVELPFSSQIAALNVTGILAVLVYMVRADRFCEGYLEGAVKDGYILMFLQRLKQLD